MTRYPTVQASRQLLMRNVTLPPHTPPPPTHPGTTHLLQPIHAIHPLIMTSITPSMTHKLTTSIVQPSELRASRRPPLRTLFTCIQVLYNHCTL